MPATYFKRMFGLYENQAAYGSDIKSANQAFGFAPNRNGGTIFDPSLPPFIFAGNLTAKEYVLTFGLSPHESSNNQNARPPEPLVPAAEFQNRLNYFQPGFPHRMHDYFAHLLWGILDVPSRERTAAWPHHHGYVTFDLVPYYTTSGKWPSRTQTRAAGTFIREAAAERAKVHFEGCLSMLEAGRPIRLAVFSGKDWATLLYQGAQSCRIATFEEWDRPKEDALYNGMDIRRKPAVVTGRVLPGGFPAVVISHLLHSRWFLRSPTQALALGERIRTECHNLRNALGAPPPA